MLMTGVLEGETLKWPPSNIPGAALAGQMIN